MENLAQPLTITRRLFFPPIPHINTFAQLFGKFFSIISFIFILWELKKHKNTLLQQQIKTE